MSVGTTHTPRARGRRELFRAPRRFDPWGVGALAATLAVRAIALVVLEPHQAGAGAYEHDVIARALLEGEGFAYRFYGETLQPSSHQAPAVPFLLAGCYALLGAGTPAARLAFMGLNLGLALAAAWGLYTSGRVLGGRGVGRAAALGFALYPALAYTVTRIQAVNWSVAFLALTAAFLLRFRSTGAGRWAAAAGVATGLGALGEPILLAPAAAGWLAVAPRVLRLGGSRAAFRLAAVPLLAAAVVAPWALRNAAVHGQPVLVKSTFWYVFWQGNHLEASGTDKRRIDAELREALRWAWGLGGLEEELQRARSQAVSVDAVLTEAERRALRARPTELARVRWFEQRIRTVLAEHPGHYLAMCAERLRQMLWFDPTNPRAYVLPYRLPYLLLAGLAVPGLLVGLRRRRSSGGGVVLAMALALLAVHVAVIASARFRLPLEALMLLPAGFSLSAALRRLRPPSS